LKILPGVFRTVDVHPSQTRRAAFWNAAGSEDLPCGLEAGAARPRQQAMYFVYIMANRWKTPYTGVTNSLIRSVKEHKEEASLDLARKFGVNLVYFERFDDVRSAIGREERIRRLLRREKIALVAAVNPEWKDLSREWFEWQEDSPEEAAA
jgi:putative endonuclease